MVKKISLYALLFATLIGCAEFRLVNDYDEVIDKGIIDFSEQFNAHVKDMGDLAGTQEGTYEANLKSYNALDAKIDVMIARASITSEGQGCKLEKKIYERVKEILKTDTPVELQNSDASKTGNANGCNERLLVLVKQQLSLVREIHKTTDKCGEKNLSCVRPATSRTALNIANQTINAVSVVETAKKK